MISKGPLFIDLVQAGQPDLATLIAQLIYSFKLTSLKIKF